MLSAIDGVATPIWLRRPSYISPSSSTRNLILADQRIFAVLQHILLLERPRAGVGDGKALVGDRRDDPSLIILLALTQARARAHAVGEAAAVDRPVGGQFGHRRETDRAALPHATARGDEIGVLAQRVADAPRRRGISDSADRTELQPLALQRPAGRPRLQIVDRAEEHTSELQSIMRISYA